MVAQQVRKFPIFYETVFITAFTRTCRWTLSWAWWIWFTASHPITLNLILILSSQLYQGNFMSFSHLPNASMSCLSSSPLIRQVQRNTDYEAIHYVILYETQHPNLINGSDCWATDKTWRVLPSAMLSGRSLPTFQRSVRPSSSSQRVS
jgi:hypothetical protein